MKHLDQKWYEQATDIIANSYERPAERLGVFNELWGEYLCEVNRPYLDLKFNLTEMQIKAAFDNALKATTGLSLQQIVNYAKEMTENGQNETKATATGPEQLG